jgi:hypothetical protein
MIFAWIEFLVIPSCFIIAFHRLHRRISSSWVDLWELVPRGAAGCDWQAHFLPWATRPRAPGQIEAKCLTNHFIPIQIDPCHSINYW